MIGVEQLILHKLSYLGMFLFLAGSGMVVPVPEEILLLTAGYFTALGLMVPAKAIPLAIAGLLVGDSILFFLARTGSKYVKGVHERFIKMGLDDTWVFSPNHPLRAVFVMRFVTGLRMIAPVYAGLNGATWRGFLITDFIALCIFVPVIFLLGFHNHHSFLKFVAGFEIARHIFFWSALAIGGAGVFASTHQKFFARFKKKEKLPEEPHA